MWGGQCREWRACHAAASGQPRIGVLTYSSATRWRSAARSDSVTDTMARWRSAARSDTMARSPRCRQRDAVRGSEGRPWHVRTHAGGGSCFQLRGLADLALGGVPPGGVACGVPGSACAHGVALRFTCTGGVSRGVSRAQGPGWMLPSSRCWCEGHRLGAAMVLVPMTRIHGPRALTAQQVLDRRECLRWRAGTLRPVNTVMDRTAIRGAKLQVRLVAVLQELPGVWLGKTRLNLSDA